MSNLLIDFLDHKAKEYGAFDPNRFKKIYAKFPKEILKSKNIQIIGTNAKGTTGRFLAQALYSLGFNVGHFTSPHILSVSERFWINGKNESLENLEKSFIELYQIFSKEILNELSYFEVLTLVANYHFKDLDYQILEAGLGGEFDSSTSIDIDLLIVTPIGYDHMEYLGNTIKEIAQTKLNAIRSKTVIGFQEDQIVKDIARNIANEKKQDLYFYEDLLCEKLFYNTNEPKFISQNRALSAAAFKLLGFDENVLLDLKLNMFGRCTKIAKNITIDVGHNPMAAKVIVEEFKNRKIKLIFNTFKDKDYKKTLIILKPIIDEILYLPISSNQRVENKEILTKVFLDLNIPFKDFLQIEAENEYLVFGSFSLVEIFLNNYRYTYHQ